MDDVSPGFTIDWDRYMERVARYTYVGSEPHHVVLADGRKPEHAALPTVVHHGDETLEITNEQIWRVLNELFGGDDNA